MVPLAASCVADGRRPGLPLVLALWVRAMSACAAETCGNWTGDGCICAVLDLNATCGACEADMHEHCDRAVTRGLACCCNDEDEQR